MKPNILEEPLEEQPMPEQRSIGKSVKTIKTNKQVDYVNASKMFGIEPQEVPDKPKHWRLLHRVISSQALDGAVDDAN